MENVWPASTVAGARRLGRDHELGRRGRGHIDSGGRHGRERAAGHLEGVTGADLVERQTAEGRHARRRRSRWSSRPGSSRPGCSRSRPRRCPSTWSGCRTGPRPRPRSRSPPRPCTLDGGSVSMNSPAAAAATTVIVRVARASGCRSMPGGRRSRRCPGSRRRRSRRRSTAVAEAVPMSGAPAGPLRIDSATVPLKAVSTAPVVRLGGHR